MEFLLHASRLRPEPPASVEATRLMLVHGVARDGLPQPLPAAGATRWLDEPYATVNGDEPTSCSEATVCLFAVTEAGCSVMLVVEGYRPWVRVELQDGWTESDADELRLELARRLRCPVDLKLESLKRFYGWVPDTADVSRTRRFKYAKLSFGTWLAAQRATSLLERSQLDAADGKFRGLGVTDARVKPLARFLNDAALTPSDWFVVRGAHALDTSDLRVSNCQLEARCSFGSLSSAPCDAIAPLLVMSFDGEMYSHDGTFPSVLKGDATIYLGASFWVYGAPPESIRRFMLCVGGDLAAPPGASEITLATFPDTHALLEGFRDLLVAADPDVVTGWNTYGFDFPFLHADYCSRFLPPEQRGSEALQVAALFVARSVRELPPPDSVSTAAKLLSELRGRRSSAEVRKWLQGAERTLGARHVKTLLKLEREAGGGATRSLSTYGVARDDEEEDEQAVPIGGLPADVALTMRGMLKDALHGAAGGARGGANFVALLAGATDAQRGEFWERMLHAHGSAVVDMLRAPTRAAGAKRGLFLGRFASEPSELVEKRMASAARGDNTYYWWGMTGRVTVDLMQVIKDDKKPDDCSLRHAADVWLGGTAKMDMSAAELFAAYKSGDPAQRWRIAEYWCVFTAGAVAAG